MKKVKIPKLRGRPVSTAPPGYMTVPEVAHLLGCVHSTVYRWLNKGKVREIRVGAQRYVERKSLQAFLGDASGLYL